MKHYTTLFLIIILLPVVSFAQSNYRPGYIVNLKGDTLKGNVDYKEWEKNPRQIYFKNNTGGVQVCTPKNVKAFAVNGFEYYEQYTVRVSQDQINLNTAGGVIDTSYRTDTVFLKTLTRGRYLSLYSYTDDIKTRYYVLGHGDAVPAELVFHIYLENNSTVHNVNGYRLQLRSIAQNNNVSSDKLTALLSQSTYTQRDLLKIATAINGSDPVQFTVKSQFGTRFFAGAGLFSTDVAFNGIIQTADSYSLFPRVATGIDFITNKQTQRLYARLEIAATGDEHTFVNTYEQSQLKLKQYTASVIPQVYYNFYSGQNVKVFAGGGISVNISSYPERYYISEAGVDLTPTKQNNYPDYHTLWETLVLKAGVLLYDHMEIYIGYSPSTTITDNYLEFAGNEASYQAGVNFLFGAK